MEKKINIEALERKTPFRVPDGYFEGLSARVMASIRENESTNSSAISASADKKPKVVGLLPRKKKNSWVKWVAAAACVCGAVFFIASQKNEDEDPSSQLANVKTPMSQSGTSVEESDANVANNQTAAPKVYANKAYDISSHVRRSASPAPANIKPQPVIRTSPVLASSPNVQIASARVPSTRTNIVPSKTPVSTTQSSVLASNIPVSTTTQSVADANNEATDTYAMEYDMLDYTNMSGTEIYDYLAGNEYF